MNFSSFQFKHPIQKYKLLPAAVKAGLWFLICNFIQKGIAVITTPIFTRLLSTSEYGRVSIFYSWADLMGIFITFGLSSAVYARGLVKSEQNRSRYTSVMIGLSLVTTCISFILFFAGKELLFKHSSINMVYIVGIYLYVLFNTISDFWYQQKRVDYDYIPFVKLTLLVLITKPVLSILAIMLFPDIKVPARIIPDIGISGVVAVVLLVVMIKKGKVLFDKIIWRESMIFVIPLIPHYISQRVLSQSDRLMISNMIGDSEAGIYSLAYSVGMLLMLLNSAMDSTVAPWAYKKIRDGEYQSVAKLCEKLLFIYGLSSLCFSFFVPEIIKIFAPNTYLEAINIVPIIALSSFFMFSYLQFVYFEYYSGKTQFVMIATGFCAVINLVLNYVFIRKYGYVAAAYTTLICYILYAVGHYFIMRYLCKKYYKTQNPFNEGRLLLISFAISAAMAVCLVLYNINVVRILIGVMVIVVTILLSLSMLNGILKD